MLSAITGEWDFLIGKGKPVLVILLIVPVFYSLVISYLYHRNQPVERPALLIDMDNSALSRRLTSYIDATQEIAITARPEDVTEGLELIKRGRAELMIYIPADFSQNIKKGKQGTVKAWITNANMLTYGIAFPAIYTAAGALGAEIGTQHLLEKKVPHHFAQNRTKTILLDDHILYAPGLLYASFLITGIFIIIMQQVILIGLSFSAGLKTELGIARHTKNYPFTRLEGSFIAQTVFYLLGTAFIVNIIFPLFGWPIQSTALMALLFFLFTVSLAPAAIAVARFMPDRAAAFQILMFVSTPLYLISGFTWPLEQMPFIMRAVAAIFPATPALQAMRIISLREPSITALMPHFMHLTILFFAYSILTLLLFHLPRLLGNKAASE